ncbi:MAG: MAPEG family protein [Hydrogenophilaceae bacterium]|jgi:uncharacterized MAPEG superfamily protein|nr:MAPEG family protein [Hydrogenophilaceae bacterium]
MTFGDLGVELSALVGATALLLVLVLVQATAGVMAQGLMAMAGSRDNLPPPKTFQARMLRVVDNHREGLIMFAPLALVGAAANQFDAQSALGAQIFLWSRVAHAVLYIAAVPLVRPLAWAAGLVGTGMVLVSLIQ